MKIVKIETDKFYITHNKEKFWKKIRRNLHLNISQIILILNVIINIYLLAENKKNSKLIKKILDFNDNNFKNNYPDDDKEMIGLYYPEINFDEIKNKLKNLKIIRSLVDFINQIEIKLIYLEKEINLTKKFSFYNIRKSLLEKINVTYNDDNITEVHELVNWIIIYKSNQLKGIASDKYLACKYVKLKLGKNLCPQRIAVYNSLKELSFEELSKYGNIVLKISNSCWKSFKISNITKKEQYEEKLNKFKKLYLSLDHGLKTVQFFHLYAKKRIIVEKQFASLNDLYEFKFFIINNKIKFIYLIVKFKGRSQQLFYDINFNFIFKEKKYKINPLNLTSLFKNTTLQRLKEYAIKLSEDFPNFIRVDLFAYHDKIYFSELTFASCNGQYLVRDEKFMRDSMKNFTRVEEDDYY